MAKPRYQKLDVDLPTRKLPLYVGAPAKNALEEVTMDMPLYKGVKLGQVLEAVYEQGMKDGRREVIESFQGAAKTFNYMPPGRPKKAKRNGRV